MQAASTAVRIVQKRVEVDQTKTLLEAVVVWHLVTPRISISENGCLAIPNCHPPLGEINAWRRGRGGDIMQSAREGGGQSGNNSTFPPFLPSLPRCQWKGHLSKLEWYNVECALNSEFHSGPLKAHSKIVLFG